jgi:hypothetical protein
MVDTPTTRKIWGREFTFVLCGTCRAPVMTVEHRDHAIATGTLGKHYYTTCASCKQKAHAERFATVGV